MPKEKPQIDPKPTTYRGVVYQSRLEARWAILLDNCKNVINAAYQPKTYRLPNGWEYTPDFRVKYAEAPNNHAELFMEIKPTNPTKEYKETLKAFARILPYPLMLVCGSIYKDNYISSWLLEGKLISLTHPADLFTGYEQAYKTAANYRFDL